MQAMQQLGAKREMGGTDFKWGGWAPLAHPLATALPGEPRSGRQIYPFDRAVVACFDRSS